MNSICRGETFEKCFFYEFYFILSKLRKERILTLSRFLSTLICSVVYSEKLTLDNDNDNDNNVNLYFSVH